MKSAIEIMADATKRGYWFMVEEQNGTFRIAGFHYRDIDPIKFSLFVEYDADLDYHMTRMLGNQLGVKQEPGAEVGIWQGWIGLRKWVASVTATKEEPAPESPGDCMAYVVAESQEAANIELIRKLATMLVSERARR